MGTYGVPTGPMARGSWNRPQPVWPRGQARYSVCNKTCYAASTDSPARCSSFFITQYFSLARAVVSRLDFGPQKSRDIFICLLSMQPQTSLLKRYCSSLVKMGGSGSLFSSVLLRWEGSEFRSRSAIQREPYFAPQVKKGRVKKKGWRG